MLLHAPKRRFRWVNNIKLALGNFGFGVMDLIDRALHRDQRRGLVNTEMNFLGP
jgi:hypothetical protein